MTREARVQALREKIAFYSEDEWYRTSVEWDSGGPSRRRTLLLEFALDEFAPLEMSDVDALAGMIADAGEPVSAEELHEVLNSLLQDGRAELRYGLLLGPQTLYDEELEPLMEYVSDALATSSLPMTRGDVFDAVLASGRTTAAGKEINHQRTAAALKRLTEKGFTEGHVLNPQRGIVEAWSLRCRYHVRGSVRDSIMPAIDTVPASPVRPEVFPDLPTVSDHGYLHREMVCPHCETRGA